MNVRGRVIIIVGLYRSWQVLAGSWQFWGASDTGVWSWYWLILAYPGRDRLKPGCVWGVALLDARMQEAMKRGQELLLKIVQTGVWKYTILRSEAWKNPKYLKIRSLPKRSWKQVGFRNATMRMRVLSVCDSLAPLGRFGAPFWTAFESLKYWEIPN